MNVVDNYLVIARGAHISEVDRGKDEKTEKVVNFIVLTRIQSDNLLFVMMYTDSCFTFLLSIYSFIYF